MDVNCGSDSLLWIHDKRGCPMHSAARRHLIASVIRSWLRQDHTLVRRAFTDFVKSKIMIIASLVFSSSTVIEDVKTMCDAGQASMACFYFYF
jgi:hypothetical protein